MPTISDSLNTLMLTSSPEAQRSIASGLTTFAQRLDDAVSLDWKSGQAQFDESVVRTAAEDLQHITSYAVGTTFPDEVVSSIQGGFAVLRIDQRDAIPWRSLTDPRAVSQLSDVRLQALGITGGEPEAVRKEMIARFPSLPSFIDTAVTARLSTTQQNQRIIATLQDRDVLLATLLPIRSTEPSRGGDGGVGQAVTQAISDVAKLVPDFVRLCFPTMEPHLPTISTGFGVCLDRDCTLSLVKILRLGGAPLLAQAGFAAIAAGSLSAALTAAVAAVGGWATLIAAICAVVFSGWLEGVVSNQGACIHFPWWAGFGPIPYGR